MPIIDTDARPPFGDTEIDHIGILTQALFFERLQKASIETAAGTLLLPSSLCSAPMTDDLLHRVNDAARILADTHPDRYIPGIHVTPDLPALSCAEIEQYAVEGVSILGEIETVWLDDPQYERPLSEIFACAAQYRMTVSIHPAHPDHLRMWADRFPALNFMYGDRDCRMTPAQSEVLLREHPNLYLRLSQDIFLANYYLHTYIDRFPTGQLLFGSGYPHSNPAARTAACLWELRDQTEETKRKIFYENAAACFARTDEKQVTV